MRFDILGVEGSECLNHFSPVVHGRSAQLAAHLGLEHKKINNLKTIGDIDLKIYQDIEDM